MKRFFLLCLVALLLPSCGHKQLPPDMLMKQTPPVVRKSEVIVIDAGHGGKDPGTCSEKHHYEEKELTLLTAQVVQTHLQALGYPVVLTRSTDVFVPLQKRSEVANTSKASLFVSIHYNHSPKTAIEGVEIYYYADKKHPHSERLLESKKLGETVLASIIQYTEAYSRKVRQENFAVVRDTVMPAILIEGGYLSNPLERQKIQDPYYRKQLARGIAQGIDHYLEQCRKLKNLS